MPIYQLIGSSTPNSVARAIANEVVAGKNAIASALINRGQVVVSTDTMQDMASKISLITGQVTVTPLQGVPTDWHDLAQVIAANTLVDYPYSFAVLLSKAMQSIKLTGSNAYICSDSGVLYGDQDHTFDSAKDNVGSDVNASWTGILSGMSTSVNIIANTVGSVGNIKLTGNGTSLNALIEAWNIANSTNTLTLNGDGTQIPTAKFYGLVNGLLTPIDIRENSGGDFGPITLIADSVKTVSALINEWNLSNLTKQITLVSGTGTQVPTSNIILTTENIILSGGVIGNIGKSTRWVIFLNNSINRNPTYNFSAITNLQGITATNCLYSVFINNVGLDNLMFRDTGLMSLYFGTTTLPVLNFPMNIFNNSLTGKVVLPEVNTVNFQNSSFYNSGINTILFHQNTKSVLYSDMAFRGSLITTISIPSGIETINMPGTAGIFYNTGKFSYIKIPVPSKSLNIISTEFGGAPLLYAIELGTDWKDSISITNNASIPAVSLKTLFLDKLVDKRKNSAIVSTCSCNSATPVMTFVNGNCLKVFRPGQNISPVG